MSEFERRRPKALGLEALYEYGVRSLGGRAQSIAELREKLRRRAAEAEDVERVLARLKENQYLNEGRFAENFAAARLNNDQFGSGRVLRDLRQRRVAGPVAEGTVKRVYEGVDESALIEEWIRRKYRNAPREALFQEEKDLASAYRRLLRAGFRSGEIVRVLKRFAGNPDLLDSFEPPCEEEEGG